MVGTILEFGSCVEKQLDWHMSSPYKNFLKMTSAKQMHWYHGLAVYNFAECLNICREFKLLQTSRLAWTKADKYSWRELRISQEAWLKIEALVKG